MEEVEVISSVLIAAEKQVQKQQIDLTPWDLQFPLLGTIQKGLLFHKPTPQQLQQICKSSMSSTFIHHLETSLSTTLQFFPPLAGRLAATGEKTTSFVIDCNNTGAQFVHAVAPSVTMASILESIYVPCVVHYFFPLNGIRNFEGISKPLFGVQVTELADGYFIGCTMNHMVVDGTSFWHFFNSWSEISRGSGKISKLPDLERWFPEDIVPIHLPLMLDDENLFKDELKIKRPMLKERVFHFSRESIARLKAKANSELGTTNISSLQAILAHLWLSVTRARHLHANEEVAISLIIVAVRSGMANKGDGKVTVFAGVEEGSFDIELCLLPETLEALGEDKEFMEAVSI